LRIIGFSSSPDAAGARAAGVGLMLTISTKVRHFAAPGHPYASSVLMDLPS
jgi:hypothetical protein